MGEGRRPEIVLTLAENSASKFYQLSSEEVGVGLGAEDECGGGDLDLHGNEPRQPLPSALCLRQSLPPLLCLHAPPALLHCQPQWACGELLGVGQGRWGQGQEIKVKAGKFYLALLPTHLGDLELHGLI